MSGTIKELPETEIEGVPTEYHIWDVSRLAAVSYSALGIEEFEVDFTEFVEDGLACLKASSTDEYQGYLAVIPEMFWQEFMIDMDPNYLKVTCAHFLPQEGK